MFPPHNARGVRQGEKAMGGHERFTSEVPKHTAKEIASTLDSGDTKPVFDVLQEMRDLYIKNPDEYRKLAKEVDKFDQKGVSFDFDIYHSVNGNDNGKGDSISKPGQQPVTVIDDNILDLHDLSLYASSCDLEATRSTGQPRAAYELEAEFTKARIEEGRGTSDKGLAEALEHPTPLATQAGEPRTHKEEYGAPAQAGPEPRTAEGMGATTQPDQQQRPEGSPRGDQPSPAQSPIGPHETSEGMGSTSGPRTWESSRAGEAFKAAQQEAKAHGLEIKLNSAHRSPFVSERHHR